MNYKTLFLEGNKFVSENFVFPLEFLLENVSKCCKKGSWRPILLRTAVVELHKALTSHLSTFVDNRKTSENFWSLLHKFVQRETKQWRRDHL